MIQVKAFSGGTVGQIEEAMNSWFQEKSTEDIHVLSILPIPTQGGLFLLMVYEET